MHRLLFILLLSLSVLPARAANRITATLTVTNTPSDGDYFILNADTRTWKTAVVTASTQIEIGAAIGAHTTNSYLQTATYPFTGPVYVRLNGTNAVDYIGQVGTAMAGTISGSWGAWSYSTQTVTSATSVRVPISAEPTGAQQTAIVDYLIEGIFNEGLDTSTIDASSPVLVNFVDTSETQTVAGAKTFTGANTYSNASQLLSGGSVTNVETRALMLKYYTNNLPLKFYTSAAARQYGIAPDANGIPSMYYINASDDLLTPANFSPSSANLLNALSGDLRYGALSGANAWTGTNTFTRITNSTIVNSTFTGNNQFSGTAVTITNGTFTTPTLQSAVNRVAAFESYINNSANVEIGSGAVVTNTFTSAVALGYLAKTGEDGTTAVGAASVAKYNTSAAFGNGATTTAANQVRLGTSSEQLSAPGSAAIGGNLAIGHADSPTFPASLAKGLYMTNGTAASADPTSGGAIWVSSGALQYRTSDSFEGGGANNRFHNMSEHIVGSGTDYTITGSSAIINFGGTDVQLALPTAGTYLLQALVSVINGGTASDVYHAEIYNTTDATSLTQRTIDHLPANATGQIVLFDLVTVTATKTINLRIYNASAARGSVDSIETSISYVRLY